MQKKKKNSFIVCAYLEDYFINDLKYILLYLSRIQRVLRLLGDYVHLSILCFYLLNHRDAWFSMFIRFLWTSYYSLQTTLFVVLIKNKWSKLVIILENQERIEYIIPILPLVIIIHESNKQWLITIEDLSEELYTYSNIGIALINSHPLLLWLIIKLFIYWREYLLKRD